MGPSRAWSLLKWSIQQRGMAGTVRTALHRVSNSRKDEAEPVSYFDQKYGVDTDGLISGGRLATGSSNDVHNASYFGMAPSRVRGGLELWNRQLAAGGCRNYSFIDLGSGKGRAVMLASELPFRRVVGVELNPELNEIAISNMDKWREKGLAKAPVELICQDVTKFEFPEGSCIVYMYNPFAAPVMEEVIRRIETQFVDRGSHLDILYFKPVLSELFEQHPGFSRLWSDVLPFSPEDAASDRVSSANEICTMYRWVGL